MQNFDLSFRNYQQRFENEPCIEASSERSGRATGKPDKMSDELEADIQLLIKERNIKQIDLMQKHNTSRSTLKKYNEMVKNGK